MYAYVHFLQTVFDCMSELLEHAVVFSELASQSKIAVKWTLYKEWLVTLSNAGHTSDQCSAFELGGLRTSLAEIESLIAGNLFRVKERSRRSGMVPAVILVC